MDAIELRGMVFYGYHGALPEERSLGQRFVVDLWLTLALGPAGHADDLSLTVNYAQVAETVRAIVEGRPLKLIEAVAEAIGSAVLRDYPQTDEVRVRVAKPSAPVSAAPTGQVAVEIRRARCEAGPIVDAAAEPTLLAPAPVTTIAEPPSGSILGAATIRRLLAAEPPLLEGLADPDAQIQPNGVDLTLDGIWSHATAGELGVADIDRRLPERAPVEPDADGWFALAPGTYMIRLHEVVNLPADLMAFGRPRSSLLRCGAALHTAVWDAGYRGRSESLMVVYAARGVRLQRGARVLQLVFARLDRPTGPYAGRYQGENL